MLYLLGINLPDEKLVRISLTSIYGIGIGTAKKICNELEINPQARLNQLPESKIIQLSLLLNQMEIEAELKRKTQNRIQAMVSIGCYRGMRHAAHKPMTGRTRSNGNTARKLNGNFLKPAQRMFSTLLRR